MLATCAPPALLTGVAAHACVMVREKMGAEESGLGGWVGRGGGVWGRGKLEEEE